VQWLLAVEPPLDGVHDQHHTEESNRHGQHREYHSAPAHVLGETTAGSIAAVARPAIMRTG